jgi:hypothetical protein
MTATMPARGDQRNQLNPIDFSSPSGFADSCRQSQIKQECDDFPLLLQLIRNSKKVPG